MPRPLPPDLPGPLPGPLRAFLERDEATPLLDGASAALEPGRHPRVAVRRPDVASLRAVPGPDGVRTSAVGLLLDDAGAALGFTAPAGWPALLSLRSRRGPFGGWTLLRFAAPVDLSALLRELGRQAVWTDPAGRGVVASSGRHDVRVLNPIGFLADAPEPVADLDSLDLTAGPTAGLVRSLRASKGVRVARWDDTTSHVVAGLALAGVPVVPDPAAGPTPETLGPLVAAALGAPVDLDDPPAREEHSLVLRRAALDTVAPAGSSAAAPSVSILLATRRADMLDFALDQVARQRGVADLELVLAPHGFDVDPGRVRERVGPRVAVRVEAQPADTIFGDVLQAAARAASGDVLLKMDDDDWYAPDVVADLLRARAYSGAELVGMPAELHYLVAHDTTVKRGHPSELYARFVAGGTMLVDAGVLRAVGGFRPVRRYVDAQLIDAVLAAGGAVYRTHGLGYVLRRNATGHTWQADDDYLLDPSRVAATWPGFRPSRLLEPDPRHLPR